MKRLILFCLILFAGASFASPPPAGPQLSFRFANPTIIGTAANVNNLQFDVQVKCDQAGYYLWASQIILSFNNSTFNTTATTWSVVPQGNFAGANTAAPNLKYTTGRTVTGTAPNLVYNISLTGDQSVATNGANPDDFAEIPITWTTLVTVKARLLDFSGDGLAGIDFIEGFMNGFQSFLADATPTYTNFNSLNLYDSRDFLTAYTGRIYSTASGWKNLWASGTVNAVDWSRSLSTTVWEGTATMPAGASNAKVLRVESPATLTIPVNGQVTVTGIPGSTTIDTSNGLLISSDATGTGSLITNSISGSGIVNSYITTGRWHLVSSPAVQTVANFLTNNANVPTNGADRGMMDYNPTTNAYNAFFTSGSGSAGAGKGYCLRTAANGIVTFTGNLQAGTVSVTGLTASKWNLIGNPYTSALSINTATSPSSVSNFILANSSYLDPSYAAVYLWDNADAQNASGTYTVVSNVPTPGTTYLVQQGQGFMVKMASGSQIDFTESMQVHSPALALKSAANGWPSIVLKATVNNVHNTTLIAYNGGMTKGLDPTYDAGLLKGDAELLVYSKLVEDAGIPFAIQALPDNYDKMIIPVGVESKTGGTVVFSAETFNLPSGVKVILEDKQAKTFTDLATGSYKAVIAANTNVGDRFLLHNSTATTQSAIGDPALAGKLNAYAYLNSEIRVVGDVSKDAVATLYDVQGKSVLIQKLSEGSLNVIPISGVSTGLYLLSVKDGAKSQTFKILLKD